MSEEIDVQAVATEAKQQFNLLERLRSRPHREAEVTVYLDEVNGDKHSKLTAQLTVAKATSKDEADWKDLADEVALLAKEIDGTAITLTMRSVPPAILKLAEKSTRKMLGITGPLETEQVALFAGAFTEHLVRDSIVKLRDHATGHVQTSVTLEEVKGLHDLLPKGQWEKIDLVLNDLSVREQIAESVATDADF